MSRDELCQLLALPDDACLRAIRVRVVRVASGKPELGSSPSQRKALMAALRLAPGSSDLAAARVVESILRPSPIDYRRGARTF